MMTHTSLEEILHERFGLSEFRPKQTEVIDNLVHGRHTLALLPTGYGKSLCYQVPSQVLPGITLVVSPLIALMQDQVNSLIRRGLTNVTLLNSSIDRDQRDLRMAGIKSGAYKLVYVAPERFESGGFRQLLREIDVSLLVIDEAHCISQWGHDFRPQYRNLSGYLSHVPGATILALTATATPAVQKDIVQSLALPEMHVVVGSFDRPNLHLEVRGCRNNFEKDECVERILRSSNEPAIIYTSSRKETEALAQRLRQYGVKAAHYHAGMKQEIRQKAQRDFENETPPVIVCTVAFGMGIDKANVRHVVHYNLPGSLENYYQEAGRAGRDGQPATCTLLYQSKDIFTQRFLTDRNYPTNEQVLAVLKRICASAPDIVRAGEILDHVDIADSALNSALDVLKQNQLICQDSDGGYFAPQALSGSVRIDTTHMIRRKRRDQERLEAMINYAQQTYCRRLLILRYFGQQLSGSRCGACDVCAPKQPVYESQDSRFEVSIAPKSRVSAGSGSRFGHKQSAPKRTLPSAADLGAAILKLTLELDGRVGRTSIALILAGSKAKKITEKQLDKTELYGRYTGFGEEALLAAIDNLVQEGSLRITSGLYPKLFITADGRGKLATM
ncbi:MAG TPA: ATP-dependent DNA helicase RecQ [Trichormus sp.]